MDQQDREQLNTTEQPRLEDILREFGSGKAPEREKQFSDTMSFQPVRAKPQDTKPEETVKIFVTGKKKNVQPVLSGDTQPLPKIPTQGKCPNAGNTIAFPAVKGKTVRLDRRDAPRLVPAEEKQPPERQLLEKYRTGLMGQYVRLWCIGLVAGVGLLHLLCHALLSGKVSVLDEFGRGISLVLFLCAVLLVPEVLIRGVMDLLHLRISSHTLTVLAAVLAPLQTMTAAAVPGRSYCEVVILFLFFQYWAILSGRSAMTYTLRTVCAFDRPLGIFKVPHPLENKASFRCDGAKLDDYVEKLTRPDLPQRVLSVYSTVLLPLSLILALLATTRGETDLLTLWLLVLLCAVPCTGAMAYSFPFCHLARRLSGYGGALSGWYSAEVFGEQHTIILRDEDLFPADSLASNGMKLFNGYEGSRVTAYALAALEVAGSPLAELFRALLPGHTGNGCAVLEKRIYDNGGVGVAIGTDIVLVGSLSFARSMGVHMPVGTRVRQAVYVSINGELAGIFAIRYKSNASTRVGLRDILANQNFSVVLATRDFLISPELIAAKYELPTDTLVYPNYGDRLRLSTIDPASPAVQGGLIAKDTFGAFGTTVAAGRTLRITAGTFMALALIAGVLGLTISVLLLFWDAAAGATPLRIVAFQLLWAAISGLTIAALLRI